MRKINTGLIVVLAFFMATCAFAGMAPGDANATVNTAPTIAIVVSGDMATLDIATKMAAIVAISNQVNVTKTAGALNAGTAMIASKDTANVGATLLKLPTAATLAIQASTNTTADALNGGTSKVPIVAGTNRTTAT